MAQADSGFNTGDWCWHTRQAAPCRVVERLALWGDKAADVMDSAEVEPVFDELFVQSLQHPEAIEQKTDSVVSQLRATLEESNKHSNLLAVPHDLDAADARKWRDHPAQFWLERAIVNGLAARGGAATKQGEVWNVRWPDASFAVASAQGEPLFAALLEEHRARVKEERDRAAYAVEARYQAIGRIGLPAVREFRRRRLQTEHEARLAALDDMEAAAPGLNAVAMLRIATRKTSESTA